EAYNVEMGISNELFPQERDETPGCLFNATPEDTLNFTTTPAPSPTVNTAVISDIEAFANFMRMLAPRSCSCNSSHREGACDIRKDRVRPLSYTVIYNRQDDCE